MLPEHILVAVLCCIFLCSCGKSPPSQTDATDSRIQKRIQEETRKTEIDERIQEESAKIAAERERLAESQQEQREKVAADLAERKDTREAKRAANLERAAAEQARREGVTAELKVFVDDIEVGWANSKLYMNHQPVKPGYVLVSPTGSSITFTKQEGDYFCFDHDEDAFSVTLKKTWGGFSIAEVKAKKPLADGFEVGQVLPDVSTGLVAPSLAISSRGLTVLKATYGAESTQRDVKDLVKAKIQNGRLNFRAHSGELGGDPIFGKVKSFYIKYISGGRVEEKSFREGENVSLP